MAAVSVVAICNLALQKLGTVRITSLTENSGAARSCNNCYEILRDRELRAHKWNFAGERVVLAPLVDAPAFTFTYAFELPADCLAVRMPATFDLDWKVEGRKILTNDGATLNLRYTKQVVDPQQFDALFVEALAAKMAWHMCEQITQSTSKKADIAKEYKDVIAEAKRINAMERTSPIETPDSWVVAGELGGGRLRNDLGMGLTASGDLE